MNDALTKKKTSKAWVGFSRGMKKNCCITTNDHFKVYVLGWFMENDTPSESCEIYGEDERSAP